MKPSPQSHSTALRQLTAKGQQPGDIPLLIAHASRRSIAATLSIFRTLFIGAACLFAMPSWAQVVAVDWGGSYGNSFSTTLSQGHGNATNKTGDYTFDGNSDAAYILPFGGVFSPSADSRYLAPAGKTGPLFTGTMLVNHSSATAPTNSGIYRWSAATDPNQLQRTAPTNSSSSTNMSMSTSYFAKKTNFLNGLNTAGPVGFSDQTNGASVSLSALRNSGSGVATVGFIAQEGSDWYFTLAFTRAATNSDFSGTITLNPYAANWYAFDPLINQLVNTSDLGVAKAGSTFTDINAFGILGQNFGFNGTAANSQKFDVTGFSVAMVPEPSTVGLLGLGAVVALLLGRRRIKK
jgi:hypothetical protein